MPDNSRNDSFLHASSSGKEGARVRPLQKTIAVTQAGEDEATQALYLDGFKDAFLGIGTQFHTDVAIYDYALCVKVLMERDGMSFEDAREFMDFNVTGGYLGPNTPVFLNEPAEELASKGFDHP